MHILKTGLQETSPGFSGGSVVFIHTISYYAKYVYFHITVKTGGGTKVQVRGQKTLMNSNKFCRSYLTANTGSNLVKSMVNQ